MNYNIRQLQKSCSEQPMDIEALGHKYSIPRPTNIVHFFMKHPVRSSHTHDKVTNSSETKIRTCTDFAIQIIRAVKNSSNFNFFASNFEIVD